MESYLGKRGGEGGYRIEGFSDGQGTEKKKAQARKEKGNIKVGALRKIVDSRRISRQVFCLVMKLLIWKRKGNRWRV